MPQSLCSLFTKFDENRVWFHSLDDFTHLRRSVERFDKNAAEKNFFCTLFGDVSCSHEKHFSTVGEVSQEGLGVVQHCGGVRTCSSLFTNRL